MATQICQRTIAAPAHMTASLTSSQTSGPANSCRKLNQPRQIAGKKARKRGRSDEGRTAAVIEGNADQSRVIR